jgi:methyl-accepting chemotaxis protein
MDQPLRRRADGGVESRDRELPEGHMMRWRDLRLALRLGIGFGLVTLLVCVIAVVGLQGMGRLRDAAGQLDSARELTEAAGQAKFRTADFAGWQTGYAFDTLRGVPGATADDAGQRAEFLASTAAFAEDLDRLQALPLTDTELEQLAATRVAFTAYLRVDDQVIAGYRRGTPEAAVAAGDLASGAALEHFAVMADNVTGLVASVRERSTAATTAATDAADTAERTLLLVAALAAGLAALLAWAITRSVTRPVRAMGDVLAAMADGDLRVRADESRRDEIGAMAGRCNVALGALGAAMEHMNANATTLASAAEQLTATSSRMSVTAAESASQAGVVATAADQVSSGVQTVAAGTEEMDASIREIAQNASGASAVAAEAVTTARATTATVTELGRSSAEISEVVRVITAIAEQTDLLALNATIEAARAGEAGKGFSVVATEVKELAQETAKATESIARRVEAIQAGTGAAIAAIDGISEIIGRISDAQTTIAAAVEEQTATTNEMARNVSEVATGAGEIARNIGSVASAAEEATSGAGQTAQAAEELSRMAGDFTALVGRFRY